MKRALMVVLLAGSSLVQAAQPSLNAVEYKHLNAVQTLIAEEKWQQARVDLRKLAEVIKRPYASALRLQTLGQVELQLDRYPQALQAFRAAYNLEILEEAQQLQLLHLRAQLQLSAENWKTGSSLLEQWLIAQRAFEQKAPTQDENGQPHASRIRADDYLWLAQAYSQQEKWKLTVDRIRTALKMRPDAPENWHQLELAGHLNRKHFKSALGVLRRLVQMHPKEDYWSQIASLQLQLNRNRSALATLRIAYERGQLKKGSNQRLLAQLMLQHKMPYQAAALMEQAMKQKRLKRTHANLRLVASAWGQAREQDAALDSLQQLAKRKPTASLLGRIARLQVHQQKWGEAERTLHRALKLKARNPERLLLLQGIARVRMEKLEDARRSFVAAQQYADTRGVADSWLQYLTQIQG
ncbi:MAG: hypothetical protein OIF57_00320 [Marinobacterium sp.]|nr:hypothetical protein [Marinobacterium sp.]